MEIEDTLRAYYHKMDGVSHFHLFTLLNVGHAVESTSKVMFLLTVESLIAASENPYE